MILPVTDSTSVSMVTTPEGNLSVMTCHLFSGDDLIAQKLPSQFMASSFNTGTWLEYNEGITKPDGREYPSTFYPQTAIELYEYLKDVYRCKQ
jgi:hypothetical protein